jgi:hypothetical protein
MTKKKTLEDSIVEESIEFRKRMEWLQDTIKVIINRMDYSNPQSLLDYLKFYKEVNHELMNAKVQNAAFLAMMDSKLKDPNVNRELLSPSKTTAGLG